MNSIRHCRRLAFVALPAIVSAPSAAQTQVTVRVENLGPATGLYLTPMWVGFHDGAFDLFNVGSAASMEMERLAEDGELMPLRAAFAAANPGYVDGVHMGLNGVMMPPVIDPGEVVTMSYSLNANSGMNRYFSYGSMGVPSNDAFIANDDPLAFEVFDAAGNFIPRSILVIGDLVWDAGTEVNDEIPMNTAFFGQTVPNTGTPEGGVIRQHPGFMGSVRNPGGTPMILADPMFAAADFTVAGYQVALITIVPTPATWAVLGAGGLVALRRRR